MDPLVVVVVVVAGLLRPTNVAMCEIQLSKPFCKKNV